jgi:hypothetical protein
MADPKQEDRPGEEKEEDEDEEEIDDSVCLPCNAEKLSN